MEPVDLALVLAVDVSASVDYAEFALMIGGLSAAFQDADVVAAAMAGPRGAVAVAVLFWSEAQDLALPWTRLASRAEGAAMAEALLAAPRLPRAGATALGDGLVAALTLLARCPAPATRQVVDVSGDGAGNRGRASGPVRDVAVAAGVVINGLAVVNEEPDLVTHYAAEVIGGAGSFAMECADFTDFAEAIGRKLVREMRGPAWGA
jgi:Mg-chelatase subunit ChlD